MTTNPNANVKEMLLAYLKELHLPAFRASYEELARNAQQESSSYEQYLLGLADRECQERRNHRVQRLLHQSRLPLEKSWQTLDLKRLPTKVVQQARSLLEGSFMSRLSAASTPLSLSRAANCRMLRYSLAARSGCCISKTS